MNSRPIPAGRSSRRPFPSAGTNLAGSRMLRRSAESCRRFERYSRPAGDRDEGWSVEGRIPWSAFAPTGGKPKPGAEWLFAICRYDYGPKGTDPITMSSAPLTRPSFHRYEDYGKLRFDGPKDESRDEAKP